MINSINNLKDFTFNNSLLEINLYELGTYNTILLDLLKYISILCGIFTIISKNPIISVLFFIGLYISIAGHIILVGIQFLGFAYILIYIGAISILFIFILMLINIRISELLSNNMNNSSFIIIITLIFNITLYTFISKNNIINPFNNDRIFLKKNEVYNITNVVWDSNILEYNNISSIGNTLYSNNVILFITASLILLLAMVGAIVITIKPTEN